MKGDFSRDTFDPLRHFSRVLMQQGRLQLDADCNEQSAILLHYLRTLARDLIGDYGGPEEGLSIGVAAGQQLDFSILPGRYYVDGILCENERTNLTYKKQLGHRTSDALESGKSYLVYLDVWERHVTALDDASIQEVALGQADTTTRAQVVWQVKVAASTPDGDDIPAAQADWNKWLNASGWPASWVGLWQAPNRGSLQAMGRAQSTADTQPCVVSPEARFRGLENQLYRVEIHSGGSLKTATFKWSRENGSVVFGLKAVADNVVTLTNLGQGHRTALNPNDWVELIDDDRALHGESGFLARVLAVDPDEMMVTLRLPADVSLPAYDAAEYAAKHVQLRRWDYSRELTLSKERRRPQGDDGALQVEEGKPLTLEDGVQIVFAIAPAGKTHTYRAGDYWMIPARVATGDVEWPRSGGQPVALPPHGVMHHYAPLGIINVTGTDVTLTKSFRKAIKTVASP